MSGIKTLFNLLLKDEAKKSGKYSGIMSIGDSVRKLAIKKLETYLTSAQKQGVNLDKLSEDELKYIIKLNEQPKVISADSPEGKGIMNALLGEKRGKVIQADFGKPFSEEVKKFRGPVETTENMGEFGKINVGIDYSASLDNPSYFGNAKNMYGDPAKSGSEYFKEIKQFHLNQINRKKKEMVPPTHPNYKILKKSLQDQEDSLTAAQIAEELGGNENMYDALRIKQINDPNAKPLKKSNYVKDADDPNYDDGPADFDTDADNETFATGGRVGLKVGTGKKFLQKVFGKERFEEMKSRDPEMYVGLLEVVDMYRKRDKEGLKMYLQKFLPHMDDAQIEDFIRGSDGTEGLIGELIRLGSGRDYKGKIEMIKRSEEMKKLRDLEVTDDMIRKPNADGGRIGYFMGSPNPKGLGLLRELLNFYGKKSDVVKNPSDFLKAVNPKAFNKMLEDAKGKVIPKEGIMATDKFKGYQTEMAKDRVEAVREMLERGKRMKGADDRIVGYKNEVKERFMRELNLSEEEAEKAADRMTTLFMDMSKMPKTPRITDEGILQLENLLKNMETGGKKARDLNADGGRIGFKDGMTRRTFLKLLGGLASIPIIGKIVKPIKLSTGVKKVPLIKTDDVAGKPEWFDTLVNKVIIEGDDVTKKFATGERQSIHQKTLDDGSVVRVTEDVDDGAIRVEYQSEKNVFSDDVQLEYKKPLPDEGDPSPAAQFTTAESGPVGRSYGPDDFEIDVDEVGGTSIRDLDSDVSKLKEYATGKKLTMKEIVEAKRRRDKALAISENIDEAQLDAVTARQGDYVPEPDDFASGGRVGLLSGGGVIRVMLKKLAERYGKKPSELLAVTNYKSLPVEVRKFLTKEQFDVIKKDMQSRRVEQFENLRDMIKSRQEFDRSAEALKKMGMDISDTMLPIMNKGVTPGGTTADDLLMMEQVIKNLRMKDRKLNASGGLAGMLGE